MSDSESTIGNVYLNVAMLSQRERMQESVALRDIRNLEKSTQAVLELKVAESVMLALIDKVPGPEFDEADIAKKAWKFAKAFTNQGYGWK